MLVEEAAADVGLPHMPCLSLPPLSTARSTLRTRSTCGPVSCLPWTLPSTATPRCWQAPMPTVGTTSRWVLEHGQELSWDPAVKPRSDKHLLSAHQPLLEGPVFGYPLCLGAASTPGMQVNFVALTSGTTLGSLLPSMWNRLCILDKSGEQGAALFNQPASHGGKSCRERCNAGQSLLLHSARLSARLPLSTKMPLIPLFCRLRLRAADGYRFHVLLLGHGLLHDKR